MSDHPQTTPPTASPPQASAKEVPAAVRWYGRYCQGVLALAMSASLLSVPLVLRREAYAAEWGVPFQVVVVFAVLWAATMLFLSSVHYAALRTPRTSWAWKIHAVVLGIGMTTLVLWPFAVPLVFAWFRPETRAFFGASAPHPRTGPAK